jgi:hypothetical protein
MDPLSGRKLADALHHNVDHLSSIADIGARRDKLYFANENEPRRGPIHPRQHFPRRFDGIAGDGCRLRCDIACGGNPGRISVMFRGISQGKVRGKVPGIAGLFDQHVFGPHRRVALVAVNIELGGGFGLFDDAGGGGDTTALQVGGTVSAGDGAYGEQLECCNDQTGFAGETAHAILEANVAGRIELMKSMAFFQRKTAMRVLRSGSGYAG